MISGAVLALILPLLPEAAVAEAPELITNAPYPIDDTISKSLTPNLSVYAPTRPNRPVPTVDFEIFDAGQTMRLAGASGTRGQDGRVNWLVPNGVLADANEYAWRSRIVLSGRPGAWSEFQALVADTAEGVDLPTTPPTPRAVEGLVVTPADGGAHVTWQPADAGPGAAVMHYVVAAYPVGGAGTPAAQVVVDGTQDYAVVGGLSAQVGYEFKVTALNDWHASPVVTSAPARPAVAPLPAAQFTTMSADYILARGRLSSGAAATPEAAADASPNRDAIRDAVVADGPADVKQREYLLKRQLKVISHTAQLNDVAVVPSADGTSVTVLATVDETLGQDATLSDGQIEQAPEERTGRYTFSFVDAGGAGGAGARAAASTWKLASATPPAEGVEEPLPAGLKAAGEDEGPMPEPVVQDANGLVEGPPLMQAAGVSSSKIGYYAWKYATKPNKKYKVKKGTDCTNFVSQAMRYGGLKKKSGWYRSDSAWWYNGTWPNYGSFTWYAAHNNFNHMWKKKRAVFRKYYNQAVVGDILYFDLNGNGTIDHAAVVNGVKGSHIWYAQHTKNAYNIHLQSRLPLYPRLRLYIAHVTG